MPMLDAFLEASMCMCVHVHMHVCACAVKDQPSFTLTFSLRYQISAHLSSLISFQSQHLAHSVPGTHTLLQSLQHVKLICLQWLFPWSEMLIPPIPLLRVGSFLSVRSYLKVTSSETISLITQLKSHWITSSPCFNSFHCHYFQVFVYLLTVSPTWRKVACPQCLERCLPHGRCSKNFVE